MTIVILLLISCFFASAGLFHSYIRQNNFILADVDNSLFKLFLLVLILSIIASCVFFLLNKNITSSLILLFFINSLCLSAFFGYLASKIYLNPTYYIDYIEISNNIILQRVWTSEEYKEVIKALWLTLAGDITLNLNKFLKLYPVYDNFLIEILKNNILSFADAERAELAKEIALQNQKSTILSLWFSANEAAKSALDFCYNNPIVTAVGLVAVGLICSYCFQGGTTTSLNTDLTDTINQLKLELAEQMAELQETVDQMNVGVLKFVTFLQEQIDELGALIEGQGDPTLMIEKLNAQITGMYIVYGNIFAKFQAFAKISFADPSGAMSAHGRALFNALANHSDSFFMRNKKLFSDVLVESGDRIKEELVRKWLGYMVTPMGDAAEVSYRFNMMSSASSSSSMILKQSFEYVDHSLYLLFGPVSAFAFFLLYVTLRVYYFLCKASKNELTVVETHQNQLFSPSINGAKNTVVAGYISVTVQVALSKLKVLFKQIESAWRNKLTNINIESHKGQKW